VRRTSTFPEFRKRSSTFGSSKKPSSGRADRKNRLARSPPFPRQAQASAGVALTGFCERNFSPGSGNRKLADHEQIPLGTKIRRGDCFSALLATTVRGRMGSQHLPTNGSKESEPRYGALVLPVRPPLDETPRTAMICLESTAWPQHLRLRHFMRELVGLRSLV